MSSEERIHVDRDHLVRLYDEGLALESIASELGVSRKVVRNRLAKLGLPTDRRRLQLDDAEIVRLYESGMTKHEIAVRMGTWDMVISKRLAEHGHPTEDRSAAMRTRLARMTADERRALSASAHDAVRGKKRTHSDLVRRANSKAKTGKPGSTEEAVVGSLLSSMGLPVSYQTAVDKYNLDVTIGDSVAVEVSGRPKKGVNAERIPKRLELVLNSGWHVILIWSNTHWNPIGHACAEYVAACVDEVRRDPSLRGQYRVVWGNGDLMVPPRPYGDDLPGILTPIRRRDLGPMH